MWDVIVAEYTEKGTYAQTDLRAAFLESKCGEHANVRTFLSELRTKLEELAAIGVIIDPKDYRSTILSSLPTSLSNFASNILASARLSGSLLPINNDALIQLISEEYDRQQSQLKRRKGTKSGKGKDADNEAMAFTSGKGKGKSKFQFKGNCYNCGEKGHLSRDCPKPPKDSKDSAKDKGKSKAPGTAHAAVESDSEDDGVFCMFELAGFDDDIADYVPEEDLLSMLAFEEAEDGGMEVVASLLFSGQIDGQNKTGADSDGPPDLMEVSDSSASEWSLDETETSSEHSSEIPSLRSITDSSDMSGSGGGFGFDGGSDGDDEDDDDEDWFSECGDDSPWGCGWEDMDLDGPTSESEIENLDAPDLISSATANMKAGRHTELYDSGAGRHISPY
jgi:hypothetical protein